MHAKQCYSVNVHKRFLTPERYIHKLISGAKFNRIEKISIFCLVLHQNFIV